MTPRSPHCAPFLVEGHAFSADEVIAQLGPLILDERRERIRAAVANRTYTIVPVMEGLYDRGNVSAVLRSAEALGYQAIHVIESSQRFKEAKRVTQGAEKWLDITCWEETGPCLDDLQEKGYRILAALPGDASSIEQYDFTEPSAIVFGNEKDGVSQETRERADAHIAVPMLGFSRSYNISVAAALCLYHIYRDRMERVGRHGDLSEEEVRGLTASYYLRSVESGPAVLLKSRVGSYPG